MYQTKVYVVAYNHPLLLDEWFHSLNEAIEEASTFGGWIYTSLIPSNSWDFYDVGNRLKCVAVIQDPRKWRIKNV